MTNQKPIGGGVRLTSWAVLFFLSIYMGAIGCRSATTQRDVNESSRLPVVQDMNIVTSQSNSD